MTPWQPRAGARHAPHPEHLPVTVNRPLPPASPLQAAFSERGYAAAKVCHVIHCKDSSPQQRSFLSCKAWGMPEPAFCWSRREISSVCLFIASSRLSLCIPSVPVPGRLCSGAVRAGVHKHAAPAVHSILPMRQRVSEPLMPIRWCSGAAVLYNGALMAGCRGQSHIWPCTTCSCMWAAHSRLMWRCGTLASKTLLVSAWHAAFVPCSCSITAAS